MNEISKENGYRETELGLLPIEWTLVSINQVGTISTGKTPPKKNKKYYSKHDIDFIKPPDLRNSEIRTFSEGLSNFSRKKAKLAKKDTILVTCIGEIGRIGYVTKEIAYNQQINAIEPKKGLIFPKFLFYTIQKQKYQLESIASFTTVPILNKTNFSKTIIPLPPLEEQKKIAGVLSAVQDAIEKTEAVIQATKDLKKSMMKHLFTYGPVPLNEKENVPLKETEIGMTPEECRIVKLNDLAKKITDGAHKTPTYTENGIPFLRVLDIQQENINWSKTKKIPYEEHYDLIKRCKPEEGDILLSKNGTIGVTKVVDWNKEFSIFVSLCLIKPIHELVNNRYLSYYLSSTGLEQIKKRTKRMTVTNLHLVEIRTLLIPIFTLSKQKKIVDILSSIDTKIQAEENKKKALEDLFNSLLHNLMTAKIRVNDLDLECVEI